MGQVWFSVIILVFSGSLLQGTRVTGIEPGARKCWNLLIKRKHVWTYFSCSATKQKRQGYKSQCTIPYLLAQMLKNMWIYVSQVLIPRFLSGTVLYNWGTRVHSESFSVWSLENSREIFWSWKSQWNFDWKKKLKIIILQEYSCCSQTAFFFLSIWMFEE